MGKRLFESYEAYARRLRAEYQAEQEKERMAKRMLAIEKEQERQAAVLAKHEEQLARLEFRMGQAESDIKHWKEQLCTLYNLLDIEEAEQAALVPGSKAHTQREKNIMALRGKIHTAESRLSKAKFEHKMCKDKLSA